MVVRTPNANALSGNRPHRCPRLRRLGSSPAFQGPPTQTLKSSFLNGGKGRKGREGGKVGKGGKGGKGQDCKGVERLGSIDAAQFSTLGAMDY